MPPWHDMARPRSDPECWNSRALETGTHAANISAVKAVRAVGYATLDVAAQCRAAAKSEPLPVELQRPRSQSRVARDPRSGETLMPSAAQSTR